MAHGTGKTVFAQKLDKNYSEKFHRVIQSTTRPKREDEVEGYDYKFITKEEFKKLNSLMFETVETQFLPNVYGATRDELLSEKVNIVVVSIEGFLSAVSRLTKFEIKDALLINIINDDTLDVERENRAPEVEEKYNLSVLRPMKQEVIDIENNFETSDILEFSDGKFVRYYELLLSKLKEIRDNPEEVKKFIDKLI